MRPAMETNLDLFRSDLDIGRHIDQIPVGGSKKDTKKGNRGVGRDKAEVLKRSWVFSSLIS